MTPNEKRNQELMTSFEDIKINLTRRGLECWSPEHPWGVVIIPHNDQEYVLSISPANFYGWLVSLQYHRGKHGTGCSCNPGNGHEGITVITEEILRECLQRGLGFASTLAGVQLHTKESYLKKNPEYKLFTF